MSDGRLNAVIKDTGKDLQRMPDLEYICRPRDLWQVIDEMKDAVKHLQIFRLPGLMAEVVRVAERIEDVECMQTDIPLLETNLVRLRKAQSKLKKEVQVLIDQRDRLKGEAK